jgi:cobalt/nickel transport system permease protein
MVGMLLVSSYSRAEAVYAAMLCRGFSGKFHSIDDFRITRGDVYFSFAMGASLLLVAFLQWLSLST